MPLLPYKEFFRIGSGGFDPYPYQIRLALGAPLVLDVPTGMGKTDGVVLAWLYRLLMSPEKVPKRLFYVLPMRVLVEQTHDRITNILTRLSRENSLFEQLPSVEIVMGGDVGEEWYRNPEKSCIVIGTQDLILSRALNRGYAMNRFSWPMAFGAANNDCYWVLDEVQLQGIGAVTASQLHAFRKHFGFFGSHELTLLSATIDESWFETADFSLRDAPKLSLDVADFANEGVQRVAEAEKTIAKANEFEPRDVAALVAAHHMPGTRSIIVVNRVQRAQEIFTELNRLKPDAAMILLHSRFRPTERAVQYNKLNALIDPKGPGTIVVTTQVIEAGVDISSTLLVTDLAPWSSIVQRLGRCNRAGKDVGAQCLWLEPSSAAKFTSAPYESADLDRSREILLSLEGRSVSPSVLPKEPMPLRDGLVLRKPEFLDLFDTSPDLAGHDVDVSPYIRPADDISVQVFWRENSPSAEDQTHRDELCPVPINRLRDIFNELQKAKSMEKIRIQNQFAKQNDDVWISPSRADIRPGIIVWLSCEVAWYDNELGFGKSKQRVQERKRSASSELSEECTTDSDSLTATGKAITLSQHAQNSERHADDLTRALQLADRYATAVCTAALWHDVGKTHHVFRDTMRRANQSEPAENEFWAKSVGRARHSVRGFRHELPGALAYLEHCAETEDADLIAYLIASHHGKMRMTAVPLPFEAAAKKHTILGTQDGDTLPPITLKPDVQIPPSTISLSAFRVGSLSGETLWIERTTTLRDHAQLGPLRLAYLELLVRLSDIRASIEERNS